MPNKICKYELELLYGGEYRGGMDLTPAIEYECSKHKNITECPYDTTICNVKKQKKSEENLEKLIKAKEDFYRSRM